MEIVKKSTLPENVITPSPVISRALLEVCVYGAMEKGTDPLQSEVYKVAEELQNQINNCGKNKTKGRVLWYIKEVEGSKKPTAENIEQAKEWVIENSVCKYYVLINAHTQLISENYIKTIFQNIKNFEESQNKMITYGIKYKPQKQ